MTTAQATKPVTFISFSHDFLVIRKPDRNKYATDGAGNLSPAGIEKGDRAQFEDRKFTTDDPVMIDYLRGHELFEMPRGFREDFDSARPTLEQQIDAITTLAAEGDLEALRELIETEESHGDHGRGQVAGPARKAAEAIERQRDRIAEVEEQTPEEPAEGGTEGEPSAEVDANADANGADGADPSDSG